MHYTVLFLLLLTLSCGTDQPTVVREVKTVSGHFRYEDDRRTVTADLLLPDSTRQAPGMLGNAMQPIDGLPGRRFRYSAVRNLPRLVRFTVDVDGDPTVFSFLTQEVRVDSLPDTLYRDRSVSFEVADRGLNEGESLVVFFEPDDRSTPKRILLIGPTSSGTVSLPTSAIDDIAPGDYGVYLVKQRVFKDQIGTTKASIQTEYFTGTKRVRVEESSKNPDE